MIGRVLFALFRRFLITAALFASGVALLLVVIEFIELTRAFRQPSQIFDGTALVGALLKGAVHAAGDDAVRRRHFCDGCHRLAQPTQRVGVDVVRRLSAWQVTYGRCASAAVLIGLLAVFALSPLVARTMVETQRIQAKRLQGFPEPRDWPAAMTWMTQRSAEATSYSAPGQRSGAALVLIDATILKFSPEEGSSKGSNTPRAVLDMDMWRLTNAVRIAADGTVDQPRRVRHPIHLAVGAVPAAADEPRPRIVLSRFRRQSTWRTP